MDIGSIDELKASRWKLTKFGAVACIAVAVVLMTTSLLRAQAMAEPLSYTTTR
jgi:hypothetical protein